MAVLNKEDLFNKIRERIGDATDEETLTFVEDVTDTFNDLETKATGDGTDWKAKYDELDESWKKKYRDRFFGDIENDGEEHITTPNKALGEQKENVRVDGEKRSFEDLFEEREG